MKDLNQLKDGQFLLSKKYGVIIFRHDDENNESQFEIEEWEFLPVTEVDDWEIIPDPTSKAGKRYWNYDPPEADKEILIAVFMNYQDEPNKESGFIYQIGLSEETESGLLVSDGGDFVFSYYGDEEEDFQYWRYID